MLPTASEIREACAEFQKMISESSISPSPALQKKIVVESENLNSLLKQAMATAADLLSEVRNGVAMLMGK